MENNSQCLTSLAELIHKSSELVQRLGDLGTRTDELVSDAQKVDLDLTNCCKFREELLLKHLVENSVDQEQMMALRENNELKNTVDDYNVGIETIMAKYREHCEGDMFIDSYQVRERYMEGLANIVKSQNERIECMVELMKLTADLEDNESQENQQLIQRLSGENEQMRRQLQINDVGPALRQGSVESSDSSTQIEISDATDPDASGASSLSSLESFISCLSKGIMNDGDSNSDGSSVVSQLEVCRFIEEAVADSAASTDGEILSPPEGQPE